MTARGLGWWAALAAGSAALAWLFAWAAFPAALLLGPMIAAVTCGCLGAPIRMHRLGFIGAQAVIGCLVAQAITPPIVASIAQAWLPMVLVVTTTIAAGALVGWLLTRYGRLPGTTAAWGSAPGGASAMVAMSEAFGADMRLVAFMQYFRVIIVVLSASLVARLLAGPQPGGAAFRAARAFAVAPFLETAALAAGGAWLALRLKIPAGTLLVPMVAGAVLHGTGAITIDLPPEVLGLAYAALGWYIGLAFTRETLQHAIRVVPQLLVSTFGLIALCWLSAWVLTDTLHTDRLTAYLATSPGGLDSVAIISLGSGANIPFVLAIQALRIFAVILTGPAIAKLITRFA